MEENSEKSLKPYKNDAEGEEITEHVGKLFTKGTTNQHEKEENLCESLQKKEEVQDQ